MRVPIAILADTAEASEAGGVAISGTFNAIVAFGLPTRRECFLVVVIEWEPEDTVPRPATISARLRGPDNKKVVDAELKDEVEPVSITGFRQTQIIAPLGNVTLRQAGRYEFEIAVEGWGPVARVPFVVVSSGPVGGIA